MRWRVALWATLVLAAALPQIALPGDRAASASGDPHAGRRMAATRYEMQGLLEKAVAEYIKILAQDPDDPHARERAKALVEIQMPLWLPEEAETAAPFDHEAVVFEFPPNGTDPAAQKALYRLLITRGAFSAQEGARWDEVHEKGFALIDYAYVWHPVKRRYEVRVAAHWEEQGQTQLAHDALSAAAAFYCLVKERLGFDPTGRWGDPIDLWLTSKGEPGARAQGRSIYIYTAHTPRVPGEWLREIAHEYGHVSFPGLGGFEDTDDPWVDGHLAEVLLAKWLTADGVPAWMPWSMPDWEAAARQERERLLGLAGEAGIDTSRLSGKDEAARDYLLGLAVRLEAEQGPEGLAAVLRKCARGSAERFVRAAKESGVAGE